MAFWSAPTSAHIYPSVRTPELRTAARSEHAGPLQLLAFYTLKGAFLDCARGDRQIAADALKYIRSRTRWTDVPLARRMQKWHAAAPPLEVRQEGYPLSFDHCCELLEWPAAEIRANGIRVARNGSITAYGWGWGGLRNWRRWRDERKQAQRIREAGHQASVNDNE